MEPDPHRASYPDVGLDRTDGGERLYVVKDSIFLSSASGAVRRVAIGFPRLGPELAGSFGEGTVSESGHVVTLLTTHAYDAADRDHAVDVYQFGPSFGREDVGRANSNSTRGARDSAIADRPSRRV